MKLVEKLNSIFSMDDEVEKENAIEAIGDILEYGGLDTNEIIEGVNSLISYVVLEKNDTLKESILHTINNAIVYQNVAAEISLDVFIPYISSLKVEYLTYVISFLGFSGNHKYVPILETFLIHPSKEIQEAAKEALSEIKYRNSNIKE
ncbi:hypothetical protein [Paenibacillus sp. Leaf72]|uniref:hypothetical protein n=1 Tax=Paenibacillus sp. Leaf72 TaxID=1736234 RepID=UPI0006FE1BF6|nr:hypothetical protein [Paenibacillus sp. Leaf72]KQO14761.1 hypothetical protein ASF12_29300 [Paenibacillus sp. Leaf72]